MAIGFPELDGTGSGGGTDSAIFNIAEWDECSNNHLFINRNLKNKNQLYKKFIRPKKFE
jgi:hypothetical protein